MCFVGKKSIFDFALVLSLKPLWTKKGLKRYLEHSSLFKEIEYNSRSQAQLFGR